jgi:hypothetical protein
VFGDGLSTLSVYPLDAISRVRWSECHGYFSDSADCFGEKGFSVARVTLSANVSLDLYNVHAEAGHSSQDVETRRLGFEQMARYLTARSANSAVVVAGDTNLDTRDAADRATLRAFRQATGLTDVCPETDCGLDRVLFKSSSTLDLTPTRFRTDQRFVDANGDDLSDHPAVAVSIAWQVRR